MDFGGQGAGRKKSGHHPSKVPSPKKAGSNDLQEKWGSNSKDGAYEGRHKPHGTSKAIPRKGDLREGKADVASPGADEAHHPKGTHAAAHAHQGTASPSASPHRSAAETPASPVRPRRFPSDPSGPFTPTGPPANVTSAGKKPHPPGSPEKGAKSPVYPLRASGFPSPLAAPMGAGSPERRPPSAVSPNKRTPRRPPSPAAASPAGSPASRRGPSRPSSGPTRSSPSKKHQDRSRSSSTKMAALLATTLLIILLISAVVTYAMTRSSPMPRRRVHPPIAHQLEAFCRSDGCKSAVESLNLSVNENVPPCDDAYAFACGGWRVTGDAGSTTSYLDNLQENYAHMLHVYMVGRSTAGKALKTELLKVMVVYFSCNSFFTKRTTDLTNIWQAAGIKAGRWLEATNFTDIFHLIVATSLVTNLPSVLRVERYENAMVVSVGDPIESEARVANLTGRLIKEASVLLQVKFSIDVLSDDVLQLADKVAKVASTARTEDAKEVALTELDVPSVGVEWKPFLDHREFVSTLMCGDVEAVRKVLTAMGSARVRSAAVYALLVPIAAYMDLEFKVTDMRERMDETTKHKICQGNTERLFGYLFHQILSEVLDEKRTFNDALRMWKNIQVSSSGSMTLASGLKLDEDVLRGAELPAPNWLERTVHGSDTAVLTALYGGDFLSNLVLYSLSTERIVDLPKMLQEQPRVAMSIPSAYMVPDFYYPTASESSVNYGTLGALVAELLFNQSFPKERPRAYAACFAKHAREKFGLDAREGDADALVRLSWVMEAAGSAVRQPLAGSRSLRPLMQLFFLRFAQPYCGEEDATRVLALRFAARRSTLFAEAFHCPPPVPVDC